VCVCVRARAFFSSLVFLLSVFSSHYTSAGVCVCARARAFVLECETVCVCAGTCSRVHVRLCVCVGLQLLV
jgi:hypothetical protein